MRRVELRPGEIRVQVRNPQRDDLTIALVTVDDAIVPFTLDGPATLGRLRSSTIVVPYEWVEGEPLAIGVTSSTGIQTTHEVAAAVETPVASGRGFLGYGAIGLLVGVVPVALGLLWLPSLRRVGPHWLAAFMALTAGLLTFLGIEALSEALELQAAVPAALGGTGLVLLGLAASALGMTFLSTRLSRGRVGATGLALALLVAIGIGVHNLGEGLAIGTSFATGELQLGAFLVVGFMVHNVTEGLGIAAPASRARVTRVAARGARADRGRARDRRHLDRRIRLERRALAALLRDRRGRRAPGRRRGGPVRRTHRPGRPTLRLGNGRIPRGHRRDVGDRAAGRLRDARSRARPTASGDAPTRSPTAKRATSPAAAATGRRRSIRSTTSSRARRGSSRPRRSRLSADVVARAASGPSSGRPSSPPSRTSTRATSRRTWPAGRSSATCCSG